MRRRLFALLLGVVVCALFVTRVASALPAPKSEAELMAMADLVIDAQCVAIVCDGAPIEDAKKTVTNYESTLEPSQAYKGTMPASLVIRGYVEEWKNGMEPTGGWHQGPVPEGWSGKLYLQEETDGTYTKVWWNAMEEDPATSDPQPLPSCEVADAGVDGGQDAGPDASPDASPDAAQDAAAPDAPGDADPEPDAGNPDAGDDDGGAPPDRDIMPSDEDDGCSCSVRGTGREARAAWLLVLVGLLGLRRRRR